MKRYYKNKAGERGSLESDREVILDTEIRTNLFGEVTWNRDLCSRVGDHVGVWRVFQSKEQHVQRL